VPEREHITAFFGTAWMPNDCDARFVLAASQALFVSGDVEFTVFDPNYTAPLRLRVPVAAQTRAACQSLHNTSDRLDFTYCIS
jgi:hypothetical protein